MRLRVRHRLVCSLRPAAGGVLGQIRLSPRDHAGQHVLNWAIDVSQDCRLRAREDAFGNSTHDLQIAGPLETFVIEASGEVDLSDTTGFVREASERFPEELYLRETPATRPDPALRAFAGAVTQGQTDPLGRLHALMGALGDHMALEAAAAPAGSAAAALAARRGPAADFAQIFVAAARLIGQPARYVAGHALDAPAAGAAGHGWAEAYTEAYGWIAFDPALGHCPVGRHLRVAVGLDRRDVDSLRLARAGYGEEIVEASVDFSVLDQRPEPSQGQSRGPGGQWQSQ